MPQSKFIELAQEIDRDLAAIRQAIRRPLEAEYASGNLTGPQRGVMQVVVQAGSISLRELSRAIGLAHSTVSVIVDRLEKRGMLERRKDEADGRITRIAPAPAVVEFTRDTMPQLAIHPLVAALELARPADRDAIVKGVKTLRRVLARPPRERARRTDASAR